MISPTSAPWTVARILHPQFIPYFIARISPSPPASSTASTWGAMERSIMSIPSDLGHPSITSVLGPRSHWATPPKHAAISERSSTTDTFFPAPHVPPHESSRIRSLKSVVFPAPGGEIKSVSRNVSPSIRYGSTFFAQPFTSWATRIFKDERSRTVLTCPSSTTAFPAIPTRCPPRIVRNPWLISRS